MSILRGKNPAKAEKINFQNLEVVKDTLRDLFDFDISAEITLEE